jgi:hypothetical protein
MILVDFDKASDIGQWYVVDDVVMGGRSNGNFTINEKGHAVFEGTVSLENNGGFSSVRHAFEPKNVSGYTKAVIRLKGDDKNYQFRVKSNRNDRHSYVYIFETSGKWQTIEIPLAEMQPSFRGYKLNKPNFSCEQLTEITFLVSNKKSEKFRLELDSIVLK